MATIILQKHEELITALTEIREDENTKSGCKAKCSGLLDKLHSFKEMFYMLSTFEIITLLGHNSQAFQSVSLTPGEVVDTLQKAKTRLQEL